MKSREPRGQPQPKKRHRVLVFLLDDVHLQDMAGPVQCFCEADELGGGYELLYCGLKPQVRSAQGLVLGDLMPLPPPRADDLVLIPGTSSKTLARIDRRSALWLRQAAAIGARLVSVCSGAFVLAKAGLLDGKSCTTHWKLLDRLRAEHPRARVLENRLFVEDGRLITSAGVVSGIDMALSIVEHDFGAVVAARVAREMVMYLRRNGDREQLSIYLDHRTHLHAGVHRVQDFLIANPAAHPALEELAHIAAMSPRNLSRVFRRATSLTPGQFSAKVKLQVARDLAEDPGRSVEDIAESCGFADARQLRRLWKVTFGIPISRFRAARADA